MNYIITDLVHNINSIFASFKVPSETENFLNVIGIRDNLNKIFSGKTCVDVIFTKNTDKMFFGVNINPTMSAGDLLDVLFSDEEMNINRYTVEIDSKLFDIGLEASEITAYILFEISSLIDSSAPIWEVRAIIDHYIASKDDVISIKESVNYSQILIFAIKDALSKVSSIKYKDNDGILSNEFINNNDMRDSLVTGLNKIRSSVFGVGTGVKEPDLILLSWAFEIYKDARMNATSAIDTLEQSKQFTGSKLLIAEIDKTIKSLQRVNLDVTTESTRIIREAKSNGSLFANLKRNGLRALEDDLYEFKIRVKNAETEEDAYYALRQINTRINLLEEYIYTTEGLPEYEIERWREVARKYRELREELGRKKIGNKKSYGLFFDYDKLDQLDD